MADIRRYPGNDGDCHLVRHDGAQVLVCGGAGWTREQLADIADDVATTTGGKLNVVALADHAQTFVPMLEPFTAQHVWLSWTEDPDDPQAQQVRADNEAARGALRLSASRLGLAGDDRSASLVASALAWLAPNTVQLPGAAAVRYCRATDPPFELTPSARIRILGPSTDVQPLDDDSVGIALDALLDNLSVPQAPFGSLYAIPIQLSRELPFFKQRYWDAQPWRRVDAAWLERSAHLAPLLEQRARALSLRVAIEVNGETIFRSG